MLEKYEVVAQMFLPAPRTSRQAGDRFDYKKYSSANTQEKLVLILEAQEYILGLDDGKNRFSKQVTLLSQAFALSVPHLKAMAIKDEVGFFQAVKARLVKFEPAGRGKSDTEIETAIKQIVDKAVVSEGIVDIFDAAGIKKPDISILSDEFMEEVKSMKRKNLAFELLKKILNDEINSRIRKNRWTLKESVQAKLRVIVRRILRQLLTAPTRYCCW